jgi:hypothetical protein
MATFRKALAGIAIVFLIASIGVATGILLKKRQSQDGTLKVKTEETLPYQSLPPVNENIYQASPSSKGRAQTSVFISLQTMTGNMAVVFETADRAAGIAEGQRVLLYDKEGFLLPIVGTVHAFRRGEGTYQDSINIQISLPEVTDVPLDKAAYGEIVIKVYTGANRLPLSALTRDENGKGIVWEARKTYDGQILAHMITAQNVQLFDEYFIFDAPYDGSGLYVLNPDEKLHDGQSIKIQDLQYQAPFVPDADQIAAIRHDGPDLVKPEISTSDAAACPINACGPGSGGSFIEKIRQLAQDRKEP